jgi:hypothetical protein
MATDDADEPGCRATYADRRAFAPASNRIDRESL